MNEQDLNILQQQIDGRYVLDFAGSGSTQRGVLKVAQDFVSFFLSHFGSRRFSSDFGTEFVVLASVGAIRNEADVSFQFARAANNALNFTIDRLAGDEDDGEIFGSAALLSYSQAADRLTLNVRIRTASGEEANIPVPIVPVEIN